MYKDKKVAVVIPAFKEERQIVNVLATMPQFVDYAIVVDDCSPDRTSAVVQEFMQKPSQNCQIVLIKHEQNQGVGGAIATGYKWCRDNGIDCAVVMAGDGQMDPRDLPDLLDPVVSGEADYAKGNRLITGQSWKKIPMVRYFGNSILSLMTKIASGYWGISDSQSGYTVVNRDILETIEWDSMYKRYGQPNDLLVKLNINNFRVIDVPVRPVYNIGEVSGIKIRKVVFTISWLLAALFWKRLFLKYVVRDFHPLVFFYVFSFFVFLIDIPLTARLFYYTVVHGLIPQTNLIIVMFLSTTFFLCSFAAMYMDMEYNKGLCSTSWRRKRD